MADPHVVTALVAKRTEMAGLIDHHQKQIHRLAADLGHLDATLKLFAPEMDLRTLRTKEHRQRNAFFNPGEVPRFLLDTLRQAGEPLTSRALAEQVVAVKGLDNTFATIEAVQKSLITALKALVRRGALAEGPKAGMARTWRIA
jgi:hypothetical protein